ncbi:MAG TPA: alpha/beta fold hydrolase [Acidimicrobiales bacterium]|jgi:alpha-beta hydrolase superfamily lysophospholipase|nr:alpha/beta fold hydrolase [Acidimicrobiales bacterium]
MAVIPTWIGRQGVAAFLHVPEDLAIHGALLLCPSLGSEQAWSYRGLRAVADQLSAFGFACLRFDYAGTGHSAGDIERGDAPDLVDDIVTAGGFLESVTGLRPQALAFGAGSLFLAAAQEGRRALDALVLWEPAISGRRWLREQGALLRVGLQAGSTGDDEVPGLSVPADLRTLMQSMKLEDTTDLASRTLIVARPGSPARRLADSPSVDFIEADDTDDLLFGDAHPASSERAIVEWLSKFRSETGVEIEVPEQPGSFPLKSTNGAADIRDRFLDVDALGLFGVVSEPGRGSALPPVVFVTTSCEPAIGPGREFVRVARELAAHGRPAIRLDLGGFGDSPPSAGQFRDTCYPAEAAPDLVRGLRALTGDHTDDVTVVGMCSGAFHALQASRKTRLATVIGVSPSVEIPPVGSVNLVPRRRRMIATLRLGRLSGHSLTRKIRNGLGALGWRTFGRLGQGSPLSLFSQAVESGTEVVVLCGAEDATRLVRKGGWIIDRLEGHGLAFRVEPGLGHSALSRAEREIIRSALIAEILPAPHTVSTPDRI